MNVRFRRVPAPAVSAVLVLGVLVAEGAASPARPAAPQDSAACRTPSTLVLEPPKRAFELPGGATAQVWEHRLQGKRTKRFVAVHIPRGTLVPRAVAASTLSKPSTPASQVKSDPNAVVVLNGGVYDPSGPAIPRRAQILDGDIRKADSLTDQGLALYEDSRTAEWTLHQLAGEISSASGTIPLGAINWQRLSSDGVTAYTHAWGNSFHPTGSRAIVLADGVVTKVLSGKKRAKKRPKSGEIFLTAPNRSEASAALKLLTPGEAVSLSTAAEGVLPFVPGRPSLGTPSSLIGVSSALVRRGASFAGCNTRDNRLRPRSALAWTADGDLIVAAVSGRGKNGKGTAGASASQWAEYLLHLGAVNAVNLDGGGSTALLVRRSVGGPLERLDRESRSQRKVADSLSFTVDETTPVVTPTPTPPTPTPSRPLPGGPAPGGPTPTGTP